MVLEGGSITVDGEGTLVTTTQCLMHPNRNPDADQARDRGSACATSSASSVVVWLPYGLALDDDTDGHVDNVAAFARPGVLVLQGCDDEAEDDWLRLQRQRPLGRRRRSTPRGRAARRSSRSRCCRSSRSAASASCVPYLNYYVGNGFVVVPVCGHPADADMVAIIADQYPGRETVGARRRCRSSPYGGGGIHCITQQVPAAS